MIPYGIIIKQNKIVMQQAILFWQKKYGLLSPGKFVASAIPVLSVFAVIYSAIVFFIKPGFSASSFFMTLVAIMCLIAALLYLTAVMTVRDYAQTTREENVQLVLTESTLEITTEFSKEVIPYNEIDCCFEKNFLLTVITDKNAFPLCVSKMHLVNGDYDTFTSLLKSKVPYVYEKRGEN